MDYELILQLITDDEIATIAIAFVNSYDCWFAAHEINEVGFKLNAFPGAEALARCFKT
jgi:hypothetical protein